MVVVQDCSIKEIRDIFEMFWSKFIFNVDVLANAQSSAKLSLFTFLPFNVASCGDTSPIKINEFDNDLLSWKTEVFYPKKFKNLRKCPIKAGTMDTKLGSTIETLENGTKRITGMEIDFLKGFASTLNFTLESFMFPRNLGQFFSNKNATGLLNRVYTNEVDLIHCSVFHQQSRTDFLSATRLFYSDKSILIIPSFVRIGPLRKLLLPSEFFTWMALLLLLFLTCLVVTILKFSPPDVEVRR